MQTLQFVCLSLALLQGSTSASHWWYRHTPPTSPATATPTVSPTTSAAPTPAPSTASAGAVTANYTSVRIEVDPYTPSVRSNCTVNFTAAWTAQISTWFVDAIASQSGSYPPVTNPDSLFTTSMVNGRKWNGRRTMREGVNLEYEEEQEHRQTGSCTASTPCYIPCCSVYGSPCYTACIGCARCGTSRNLRSSSRMLDHKWWSGNSEFQGTIADSIQFAAKRWLSRNDPTQCMGNAWKISVQVTYITG